MLILSIWLVLCSAVLAQNCKPSPTVISGSAAKQGSLCSNEKIFEDNFDSLNTNLWKHESTLSGGGNWEFQWYSNDPKNSFTRGGNLHICPTLTVDSNSYSNAGIDIYSRYVDLNQTPEGCTRELDYGCSRRGTQTHVINPIRSAQIKTTKSFNFKYGRLQVRAKIPAGDWLWPAIWLHPSDNVYGPWPISGEIDLLESMGNRNMKINQNRAGPEHFFSALHFGPTQLIDGYKKAQYVVRSQPGHGFNKDFHVYEMEWTPEHITFKIDGNHIGTARARDQSFFERGRFGSSVENPWRHATRMAPFDQKFHLIMNLAVGGVNDYFPDKNVYYKRAKPWSNKSPNAATNFWEARNSWEKTWNLNDVNNYDRCLIVDYVRVYAI